MFKATAISSLAAAAVTLLAAEAGAGAPLCVFCGAVMGVSTYAVIYFLKKDRRRYRAEEDEAA